MGMEMGVVRTDWKELDSVILVRYMYVQLI